MSRVGVLASHMAIGDAGIGDDCGSAVQSKPTLERRVRMAVSIDTIRCHFSGDYWRASVTPDEDETNNVRSDVYASATGQRHRDS